MNHSSNEPQKDISSQEEKTPHRKKYWSHKNLKLILGISALIFLPLILIAAILGPKVIDTTKGTNTKTQAAEADPAVVGQWSEVTQWPVKATHTSLLPDGKVMTWPSFAGGGDNPHIWDPISNNITAVAKAGYNIFCSGHTLTADGRLFSAGGHIITPDGLPHASIYDPTSNTWNRVPDMNAARWYPTTTMLNNGDILVMSGTVKKGVWNDVPQVFVAATNKWRTLSAAAMRVSYYPFVYQFTSKKVFVAGNSKTSRVLEFTGTGRWLQTYNSNFGGRSAGTSVMYEDGKIMIAGGGAPTRTVETINIKATSPKWTYAAPMITKRRHANSTLLPTGEVLITGGTQGNADQGDQAVKFADIWNPTTNKWTRLSANTVFRGYHSTALLLPDGRVLSAGGERSENSMEIFSPPYLFKGARPTITNAPTQVNYGQTFFVETPNAANISRVRWIRLGSVTHSFNESQRINTLTFAKKTNGLDVTATANGVITPPGHYMLFILNGKGVPSVAKIIKVGNINSSLPNPPLPSLTPIPPVQIQSNYQEDMKILNAEGHEH